MNVYDFENPNFGNTRLIAISMDDAMGTYRDMIETEKAKGHLKTNLSVEEIMQSVTKCECVKESTNEIMLKIEELLCDAGGYIFIPEDKRQTYQLSDGDEEKVTKIKSVVWICEYISNGEDMVRVKVIDEDDVMWDLEEYMDNMQLLIFFAYLKKK